MEPETRVERNAKALMTYAAMMAVQVSDPDSRDALCDIYKIGFETLEKQGQKKDGYGK
ncbi:MAG: hypothetical protein HY832_03620 [Candidatus Aenigmarchaeota archaeon]|nr:hypothetical protein [Candidatus Aenigmarchaeota archaeon]